ncbi:MAG: hypothetical protein ACRDIY_09770 [Chloroflexota bacterium]
MINGERDHLRRIESCLWRILDGGPVLLPDAGHCQDEESTVAELVGTLFDVLGAPRRLLSIPFSALAEAGLSPIEVSP